MFELLVFGGIIFWIVFGITLFAITFLLENGQKARLGWPTTLLLVFCVLFYWANVNLITGLFADLSASTITLAVLGYLILGLIWSFFRWGKFVKETYKTTIEYYKTYGEEKLKAELERRKPKVEENKEQLSAWIFYWPFSILRYILGDLLSDLGRQFVKIFGRFYNGITTSAYKS